MPKHPKQIAALLEASSKRRFLDEDVFVENSSFPRHRLKERIIKNNLIQHRCAVCEIGPVWMGKPMPLILDHINGEHNDNRLTNLRFVCSNCDSQLDTYKSRNRKQLRGVNRTGAPAPS